MNIDFKRLFEDSLIVSICWFGSFFARTLLTPIFGYEINPLKNYIIAFPFILFFWIITAIYVGIYRRYGIRKDIRGVQKGFQAWLISALVSMSFAFLVRELHLSRSVIIIFSVSCFIALTIKNYAFSEEEPKKSFLIGSGNLAIRVIQKLEDMTNYKIEGIITQNRELIGKKLDKYEIVGTISDLKEILEKRKPDAIIFADENLPLSAIMAIISNTKAKGIKFLVASPGFEAIKYGFDVEFVGDIPLVELGFETTNILYEPMKRIFDFVISLILLILLIPVFVAIAIAIKIDSEGPVFFIQERVGKDGKIFRVIKFRTMYKDVPKYSLSPRHKGDPRITRVGRFLRRWSLDELPQLINVLKGDMSLVGPRPEMPQIVEEYEPWQRERLRVKPGITGIWQILGRKDLPLEKNIQYDLVYIKNRSFLLDLIIILKTIPLVIKGKGAY